MPLLLALILLTLAEISLYVTLGAAIGLWLTLAVVLGTGLAGVLILRSQGRHMIERLVNSVLERRNPLTVAGHGMLMAIAGVLLILPGFLTDLAGLILLLPPVRQAILHRLAERARRRAADLAMEAMLAPHPHRPGTDRAPQGEVIDGQAEAEPPPPGCKRPSGWTRP